MKIRWKLFLLLLSLTAGTTLAVMVVAERQFRRWVKDTAEQAFLEQVDGLLESRRERLAQWRERCAKIARHEFVVAELQGTASSALDDRFRREVMDSLGNRGTGRSRSGPVGALARDAAGGPRPSARPGASPPRFGAAMAQLLPPMGVVTLDGEVRHFGRAVGGRSRERRERTSERLRELSRNAAQTIAYVVTAEEREGDGQRDDKGGRRPSRDRRGAVQEVVVTPVEDPDGRVLGWFFLGIDAETQVERAFQQAERVTGREARTGLVVDGSWFVPDVAPDLVTGIEAALPAGFWEGPAPAMVSVGAHRYLVIASVLNPGSPLGRGYHVSVFSLDDLIAAVAGLRASVGLIGGLIILFSVVASFVVAKRMTRPIEALVAGTERVRGGDLESEVSVRSKDEFGVLGRAFNAMTKDLAMKERYREVLGKVSDPSVARQLMEGELELGGEICEAAVVFCDIRGFTAMTEGMDPAEVIAILNRHMTAMTRVVYDHGGVVDKFVGDLVMAVFGVPVKGSHGARRAAGCALALQEERDRLDAASGRHVPVGIGVAFGEVVAGCMGSADRLNYTVLGDRVNLASRLCSVAGEGEILVDAAVAAAGKEFCVVEEREAITLHGFSVPVPVFALRRNGR